MASVTYKCPNCGAYVAFRPDKQKWSCDFCSADFTEQDLLPKAEAYAEEAERKFVQAAGSQEAAEPEFAAGEQVAYHCASCGSEIITDATTVATHCYYCHNPVVLQGKLTADMKPDQVLPFTIGKGAAVQQFMDWIRKKRFVPKGFFSQEEVNSMTGVYYPHFITECEMDAALEGEGKKITTTTTARYIVTKTDHYSFRRRADIHFSNVMRSALKSVDRKLSDGIHPFPLDEVKPFSSAYLSGFLAERRDIDAAELEEDIRGELTGYAKPMLAEGLPYQSYTGNATGCVTRQSTRYALLPAWVLTYQNRKSKDNQPYYYVMNGSTGKVCGKLPIDSGKLYRYGLLVAGALFAVLCALAYWLL